MNQLKVDQRGYDLKSHGEFDFPFRSSQVKITYYEGSRFATHWHPELEFTLILKGSLFYQVNDRTYELRTGDGIFANSGALHSAWQTNGNRCTYVPITIDPALIYSSEQDAIYQKYIDRLVHDEHFASLYLNQELPRHQKILGLLADCHQNFSEAASGFELRIKSNLYLLWEELFLEYEDFSKFQQYGPSDVWQTQYVKTALRFIKEHYQEKITLSDIAKCCGLSREELCRKFRKSTRQSPIEFLMHYRIRRSLKLLMDSNHNITQVAINSGFQSPSYYSELFRHYMGMTPSEYVKSHQKQ